MSAELLLGEFDRVCQDADAAVHLRDSIVELALRGDLIAEFPEQLSEQSGALDRIYGGMEALVRSRPRYRWSRPRNELPAGNRAPRGWCLTQLTNTGLYINGIAFKPSDWVASGRPIIRIQNLSGFNNEYNYAAGEFPDDNLVSDGDLLVSWSATLNTFIWHGPQGVVNQHIFKVIPNREAVTPEFLYWLLKHEVRQLAQSQHAHGLAMMHINRGPFLAHPVLLPPLDTQRHIVKKLDEVMTLCDQLELAEKACELRRGALRRACLDRLTESVAAVDIRGDVRFFLDTAPRLVTKRDHVAELRRMLLNLAVRGRLVKQCHDDEPATTLISEIRAGRSGKRKSSRSTVSKQSERIAPLPVGWTMTTIGDLFDVYVGATPSRDDPLLWDGDIPWVSSGEVAFNRISSTRESISERAVGDSSTRLHPPGTVMLGMIGQGKTRGQPAILEITAAHNQNCASIRVSSTPIPPAFIFWVLAERYERTRVLAEGGSQPALNGNKVRSIPLALPPLAEQRRIVAKVEELMILCDELEDSLAADQAARSGLLVAVLQEARQENRRSGTLEN